MSTASRIVLVEDFDYLPAGYKMLQTFGDGAEALVRAVNEELDDQLRRRAGVARFEVAAHVFVPAEVKDLIAVLAAIDTALKDRPNVSCGVDVLAFLPGLFSASRGERALMATSGAGLRELAKKVEAFEGLLNLRIWLLDGQADDGSVYGLLDIAEMLEHFDPSLVPGDLNDAQVPVHFMSFGGRIICYPRSRIIDDLSCRFAQRVFKDEPIPPGGPKVLFPLVTRECAAYLDQDVHQTIQKMAVGRDGMPIVPAVSRPALSADLPVKENESRVKQLVDNELLPDFDEKEAALLDRRGWAIETMSGALHDRVRHCVDESDGHMVMAHAFLEVLQSGTSSLAQGTQVSTGKSVTLRDAFKDSIDFFRGLSAVGDGEGGEDSELPHSVDPLKSVTDLQREIDEDEEWIAAQEGEIAILIPKLPNDGIAAKIEAKREMIEERSATLAEKRLALDAIVAAETKWLASLETTEVRAALHQRLEEGIGEKIKEAASAIEDAAGRVDKTKTALAAAQEEMRHMVVSILLKAGGLALGLIILALLAALLLPMAGLSFFGGPALFALFGGAISFWLGTIWWIVSAAAFVAFALLQLRKYFVYRRKLRDLAGELEARKASLLGCYTRYWDAYCRKFYGQCDLVRHGHIFDTWRALDKVIDSDLERIRGFCGALEPMLSPPPTAEDIPGETLSELVVVDHEAVDALLERRRETADNAASKFFAGDGRSRSHYLEAGPDALKQDLVETCKAEVYPESLLPPSVSEALGMYDVNLLDAVEATPVFLPLDPESRKRRAAFVIGPGPELLRTLVAGLHPAPTVLEADDKENIILLRVAYDIRLENLPSLGEG